MSDMTAEERADHIQMIGFGSISQSYRVRKYLVDQIRFAERAARLRGLEDAANHLVNSAAGFHCPSRELLGHFKLAEDHIRALMDKSNDDRKIGPEEQQ